MVLKCFKLTSFNPEDTHRYAEYSVIMIKFCANSIVCSYLTKQVPAGAAVLKLAGKRTCKLSIDEFRHNAERSVGKFQNLLIISQQGVYVMLCCNIVVLWKSLIYYMLLPHHETMPTINRFTINKQTEKPVCDV